MATLHFKNGPLDGATKKTGDKGEVPRFVRFLRPVKFQQSDQATGQPILTYYEYELVKSRGDNYTFYYLRKG